MKVMLGVPGLVVPMELWDFIEHASLNHDVKVFGSCRPVGNFNKTWCEGNNAFERGERELFAMLHTDTFPNCYGWLDPLIEDVVQYNLALLSVPIAIKDPRGKMSCGLGDENDPWTPFRLLTATELMQQPPVFDAATLGYPGRMLLHNNGCWIADLRFPQWRQTDSEGGQIAHFEFREKNYRNAAGEWDTIDESEDWFFSRKVHELGLPSAISRRVTIHHEGKWRFSNNKAWGSYKQDEDLRYKWDRSQTPDEGSAGMNPAHAAAAGS
jgi:hypothetical protein